MNAVLMAAVAAMGFAGASLLALLGGELGARGRSYSAAFAAGILLALAFVDLFPEGLELAERAAIAGFVGGFALMFLTEAFTRAHMSHTSEERLHKHALGSFVLGLAVHNLADGFVLGVGARAAEITSWLVGPGRPGAPDTGRRLAGGGIFGREGQPRACGAHDALARPGDPARCGVDGRLCRCPVRGGSAS
jgi:hypothetical protein